MRFLEEKVNPNELSPLTLAFVGDCVYELFVRESLVCEANRPVNDLHKLSTAKVCAGFQAEALKKIDCVLTEKEKAVAKRGRNAHSNHTAKNASVIDYRLATGLESLFGYLYLNGESDRLKELFKIIIEENQ